VNTASATYSKNHVDFENINETSIVLETIIENRDGMHSKSYKEKNVTEFRKAIYKQDK
jgi:hypothetical protein